MVIDRTTFNVHAHAGRQVLTRRTVQVGAGIVAASLLLSILLAPNATANGWDWFRLWLSAACGGLAVLFLHLSQRNDAPRNDGQQQVLLAGVLVVIGFALNLTFSPAATGFYALGLIVAGYLTLVRQRAISGRDVGAIVATLVPFWVWSALDAWTSGLLLLLPLIAVGVIVDGHMRRAADDGSVPDSLTPRGHRLAAWLGVLGSALVVALISLLTGHALAISALAGIGAIVLVALEAASPSAAEGSWRVSSVTIIDAAMAWIALCWLVGLS